MLSALRSKTNDALAVKQPKVLGSDGDKDNVEIRKDLHAWFGSVVRKQAEEAAQAGKFDTIVKLFTTWTELRSQTLRNRTNLEWVDNSWAFMGRWLSGVGKTVSGCGVWCGCECVVRVWLMLS